MKKSFLFPLFTIAASLFSTGLFAQAQTTGNANLTVNLSDVYSIVVASPDVHLNFSTVGDYIGGVNTVLDNHLVVTSTKGYIVTVKSSDNDLQGPSTISANTIKVTPAAGTDGGHFSGPTPVEYIPAFLTLAPQTIIKSDHDTFNGVNNSTSTTKFKVTYAAGLNGAYVGKTIGDYTTTVTYTIAQQ